MKNFIITGLLSLFFSVQLLAGQDTYEVENDVYNLEIASSSPLISFKIDDCATHSLRINAKASEIINYFNDTAIDFEAESDQTYKINLQSSKKIDDIKDEVLAHFLKAAELERVIRLNEEEHLILSYKTGEATKSKRSAASSKSSLNIQLDRRIILRGLNLATCVETLNEAKCANIFEVGESDVDVLPRVHLVKRKLKANPVSYLESKGFVVEKVSRMIDTPIIVDSEALLSK